MIDGVVAGSDWTTEYKVNDRVEFLGAEGTVVSIDDFRYKIMNPFPIKVTMDSGRVLSFCADGRYMPECKVIALKVIGHKRPPVKRWLWAHENAWGNWRISNLLSEDEADDQLSDCKKQRIEESMEVHDG